MIQKRIKNHNVFSFKTAKLGDIEKKSTALILRRKQLITNTSIPPKIFKKFSIVSASVSHKLFNDWIEKSEFPQNLKLADITPVYKKNDPLDKRI